MPTRFPTCEGCMCVCVGKGTKEERKEGKTKKSREARAKDIREEGEKYNLTNKVARGVGRRGDRDRSGARR